MNEKANVLACLCCLCAVLALSDFQAFDEKSNDRACTENSYLNAGREDSDINGNSPVPPLT